MAEAEALMQRNRGRIGRDDQRIGAVNILSAEAFEQRRIEPAAETRPCAAGSTKTETWTEVS